MRRWRSGRWPRRWPIHRWLVVTNATGTFTANSGVAAGPKGENVTLTVTGKR